MKFFCTVAYFNFNHGLYYQERKTHKFNSMRHHCRRSCTCCLFLCARAKFGSRIQYNKLCRP